MGVMNVPQQVVYHATNLYQAYLLESLLEQYGIPAQVTDLGSDVGNEFVEVKSHAGLVSVQVGLPRDETPREFLMITTWRDLDALKIFAGERWREARIEPSEAPLLDDTRVHHYEEVEPASA